MPLGKHAGPIKLGLHAAASVALAAWISPLVFNAGQALVEVTSGKPTNGPLEHLAALCRRMDFHESFAATAAGCALLLFIPFVDWLRPGTNDGSHPWRARLPRHDGGGTTTRRLLHGPFMASTGFAVTAIPLLASGLLLAASGILPGAATPRAIAAAFPLILGSAIIQSILMEGYFRSVALGVFLRSMRPATAISMSALFFTAVFCALPRSSPATIDPEASGAGFALLTHHLASLARPAAFIATAAPVLALGYLLAIARWRTASLWMPAGIHAGWLAGFRALEFTVSPAPGALVRTALSLAVVFLAFVVIRRVTPPHEARSNDH